MESPSFTVLVFGHLPQVRADVRTAVGRRPAAELGRIDYIECSDVDELIRQVDAGGVDLVILDAEAQPTGGMGIARQLKHEIDDCPAMCLLLARADDRWLATWSMADATLVYPLDPMTAGSVVADLLRRRSAGLPVRR